MKDGKHSTIKLYPFEEYFKAMKRDEHLLNSPKKDLKALKEAAVRTREANYAKLLDSLIE